MDLCLPHCSRFDHFAASEYATSASNFGYRTSDYSETKTSAKPNSLKCHKFFFDFCAATLTDLRNADTFAHPTNGEYYRPYVYRAAETINGHEDCYLLCRVDTR